MMTESIIQMIEEKILIKEEKMDRYFDVGNHERTRKLDIEIDSLKEILTGIKVMIKVISNKCPACGNLVKSNESNFCSSMCEISYVSRNQ
jgi:hypothetical protein